MSDQKPPQKQTGILSPSDGGRKMPARTTNIPAANAPRRTPWRLLIKIGGESHTTIGLEVKDKIIIGRKADSTPDLDLGPYGAEKFGVSRQHAQITRFEKFLYIEDLKSTNGTHLNGYFLEPYKRYRLRDGDELALGKMRVIVRFVTAPTLSAEEASQGA